VQAIGAEFAFERRATGLDLAAERWGRLAALGAYLWVTMLYASPAHWWPVFERFRLGLLTAALCAGAVLMKRLTAGERLRAGGPLAIPLYLYLAIIPLSLLWTIHAPATEGAIVDAAKLVVVFVAIQSALDTPSRLRTFFAVASVASLAPALGGVRVWLDGENLVEGFRTHWYGVFADSNRLAMNLVVVLPMTLASMSLARRPPVKAFFAFVAVAQLAAIVLTHSRSGAVATVVAAGLWMLRGGIRHAAKGALAGLALAIALVAFAPQSFWDRSSTITHFEDDASVAGRERAWQVLGAIWEERPLGGVGAGAFIHAWDAYAPLSAGGRHLVAHNVFIEVLGELGLVALLAFFAFVVALHVRLWFAGHHGERGVEARVVFAALAGYMVMELVNGYTLSWWLYLLFACGAAALRHHDARERLRAEDAP
jgi:O-antigen ligase